VFVVFLWELCIFISGSELYTQDLSPVIRLCKRTWIWICTIMQLHQCRQVEFFFLWQKAWNKGCTYFSHV
jgi:hypothetical protein